MSPVVRGTRGLQETGKERAGSWISEVAGTRRNRKTIAIFKKW